mmetsp:Transcript_7707/g.15988  ORF Transcript_7707/g.15988 Transcript_7707/m.15988 type:complete len:89 (-) Transcript_7707:14-280(-)
MFWRLPRTTTSAQTISELPNSNSTTTTTTTRIDFLDQYRLLQLQDLGRWYGATNSRNPNGDANHGCMPGPPDDKANFLLWYMLSLSEL